MLFSGRRRKVNLNAQSELYEHAVQFYVQPPLENISLNEFETFAVERLKRETPDLLCLSEKTLTFTLSRCVKHLIRFQRQILRPCHIFILLIFSGLRFLSSVIATAVLKTIETLGVSYVKLSEQYKKKLESESKNLNFPYRSETVSIFK